MEFESSFFCGLVKFVGFCPTVRAVAVANWVAITKRGGFRSGDGDSSSLGIAKIRSLRARVSPSLSKRGKVEYRMSKVGYCAEWLHR